LPLLSPWPHHSPDIDLSTRGLTRFTTGDYQGAAADFRLVADAAPHEPVVWNNLALALIALKDREAAVVVLHRSLDLDPAQPVVRNSLANTLLWLERFAEAEAVCATSLAANPADGQAWQICGLARAQREDFTGAAEALSQAIAHDGQSADLCLNLGLALLRCGRFAAAAANLHIATRLAPGEGQVLEVRQLCDFLVAAVACDLEQARAAYPLGELDNPATLDRVYKTALLYLDWCGLPQAAATVAQDWTARRPDNGEAQFLLGAALSHNTPRQPADVVAQHFDAIAHDFDDRLARRLDYQGPQQIAAMLSGGPSGANGLGDARDLDVLDLGCGTGLCGPVLRPYARRLEGVDLSRAMLARAEAGGAYDHLEAGDLLDALTRETGCWDLLVAADALPYLGDLSGLMDGVHDALRSGGWFAFTTENGEGDGYLLKGAGRYAHAPLYVVGLVRGRFEAIEAHTAPLRRDGGKVVEGGFYLLRKI
jgi:predicted TPR repeat methyltransferase